MSKLFGYTAGSAAKRLTHAPVFLSMLLFLFTVTWQCISPVEAAGALSASTTNPRYFVDQNGKAVYLAGSYLNEYNLLSGSWDFDSYLEFLQQQNHNFTRVWAWEQSPWSFDAAGQFSFTIQPYQRTGPGLALDGDLKFDLTQFNQAYFDQLRSRVIAAGQKGIYVSVMLFEGFSNQKRVRQVNPWLGDPLQQSNNINGINGDPNQIGGFGEFFSLSDPSLLSLEETFARKVVDTLNDLDNVLYEISADGSVTSLPWQYHMVDYLKSYEATKPKQHPVGISQFYSPNLADVLNSSADWVVIQASNLKPPLANQNKVLFLEANPALFTSASSHQWIWKSLARGYNVIYPEPTVPNNQINNSIHAAIAQSVAYSQFMDFSAFFPSQTLCSSGYCLTDPAKDYLAYLPSGGRVTVDLSGSHQKFVPAWFDPVSGNMVSGSLVAGGKKVTLRSPINRESVLQLQTQLALTTNANTLSSDEATITKTLLSSAVRSSSQVATPSITPNGGIFSGSVSVSLQTTTPGAVIYYTTDGQSPTQSSLRYKSPFVLTASTLVKAVAFKGNLPPSSEANAWFSNANASNFNFSLANSGDISLVAGSSAANTVTATLGSGSSQAVSFSASGLPSGATASFSSVSCNPTCSTTLNISTSGSTPAGTSTITVTAAGGGLTTTTSFSLTVSLPTVATPTITPDGGSYVGSVSVTMQTATSGASIYYTTDGSTPTQSSTPYSGAMTLTNSALVRAAAFASGYNPSADAGASFTVTQPFDFSISNSGDQAVVAGSSVNNTIAVALVSGNTQSVSFSVSGLPSGATGSFSSVSCSPTCSTVLTISTSSTTAASNYPITISASGGGVTKTTSFTLSITAAVALVVATPTITPNGGSFSGSVSVTMQTATPGASIYYTTDGSTPTQNSSLFTGAITLASSATVNAEAFMSGYNPSSVASASFIVTPTGNTYYVGKTGSDSNSCAQAQSKLTPKLTIAAGILCLSAGDSLFVQAGTYTETLSSYSFQFPFGTSWSNPVIIRANPGDTVTLKPADSTQGVFNFAGGLPNQTSPQYIVVDGFIFDGTGTTAYALVRITNGANHIRLQNSELKNSAGSSILVSQPGSNYNEFINLDVHDTGEHGIYIWSQNNLVEKSKFHDNAKFGIHLYDGGLGLVNNNIVRKNLVYNNGKVDQTSGGIIAGGSGNLIYDNIFYGDPYAGIRIQYSSPVNVGVFNNTIYNCGSLAGIYVGSDAVGTIVKNNIIYSMAVGITDLGSSTIISNNLLPQNNPLLVNPSGGNFYLQQGSPAIDAGATLNQVADDFSGVSRPQGMAYDIGAYEYVAP